MIVIVFSILFTFAFLIYSVYVIQNLSTPDPNYYVIRSSETEMTLGFIGIPFIKRIFRLNNTNQRWYTKNGIRLSHISLNDICEVIERKKRVEEAWIGTKSTL